MLTPEAIRQAMAAGSAQGQELLQRRNLGLQRRRQLRASLPSRPLPQGRVRLRSLPVFPQPARDTDDSAAAVLRSAAPEGTAAAVLLAEGDSWFDYPLHDVLKALEDDYDYCIHSVARRGELLEQMAYEPGQLDAFSRTLDRMLMLDCPPQAILLSGGGNDLTGDNFASLLNHAASAHTGFNDKVLEGIIDERLMDASIRIISTVSTYCRERCGAELPILVHGYANSVPDGRGVAGGWGPLPGPWLQPGFHAKGYLDLARCQAMIVELMERFNVMMARVVSQPGFAHVRYLDLRPLLLHGLNDYRAHWANELHPNAEGFRLVARRFDQELRAVLAP